MYIVLYLIGFTYLLLGYLLPRHSIVERLKLDRDTRRFYAVTLYVCGIICLVTAVYKTAF